MAESHRVMRRRLKRCMNMLPYIHTDQHTEVSGVFPGASQRRTPNTSLLHAVGHGVEPPTNRRKHHICTYTHAHVSPTPASQEGSPLQMGLKLCCGISPLQHELQVREASVPGNAALSAPPSPTKTIARRHSRNPKKNEQKGALGTTEGTRSIWLIETFLADSRHSRAYSLQLSFCFICPC